VMPLSKMKIAIIATIDNFFPVIFRFPPWRTLFSSFILLSFSYPLVAVNFSCFDVPLRHGR